MTSNEKMQRIKLYYFELGKFLDKIQPYRMHRTQVIAVSVRLRCFSDVFLHSSYYVKNGRIRKHGMNEICRQLKDLTVDIKFIRFG